MRAARILIVDDDAEIRQLLGEELRDFGHQLSYAGDAVQALAVARRERPDLILLDLRLPGGDGFYVLERLSRMLELAPIPVIVFSGVRTPEAEQRALALGARAFVHKSFRGNRLTDAVECVLGGTAEPVPSSSSEQQDHPGSSFPAPAVAADLPTDALPALPPLRIARLS